MEAKKYLIGAIVIGVAFTMFKNKVNNFFGNLAWRFANLQFDGIGGDFTSVRLLLSLEVDNKNAVGIPLQSFDGFVYFKGASLVPVKTVAPVTIVANKKSVIRITIPLSLANLKQVFGATWKDIFTNISTGLRPGNYTLQGTMTFNVSNVLTKFPINEPFYVS
jgi:hypothetical protein